MTDDEKDPPAEEETPPPEDEETPAGEGDDAPEPAEPDDEAPEEDAEADEDDEELEDEEDESEEDDEPAEERAPRAPVGPAVVAGWALAALIGLNLTGVVVALPAIQADVDASFRDLVWVQVAFLGALAVVFPLGRVVAGALGRRPTIVLGAVLIAAGTGLALVTDTSEPLIAGRALQGAGAGLLLALLPARGYATAAALAFGPLIAGALIKALDWQWVFWLQFALIFAVLILGVRTKDEKSGPVAVDPWGAVAYAVGLPALLIALVQVETWDWWVNVSLGFVGVVGLGALLPLDRRTDTPFVDLRPLRDRSFAATAVASAVLAGSFWAALLFQAQSLQDVFGHDALETGAILLTLTLPVLVAGPLSGRFHPRTLMMGALVLGVGGLVVLALVRQSDDDVRLVPGLLLLGLGVMGAAAALPGLAAAKLPPLHIRGVPQPLARGRSRPSKSPHSSRRTGRSTSEREGDRRHRDQSKQQSKRGPRKGDLQKRRRPGAAEAAAAKKRREEREKAAGRRPDPTPTEESTTPKRSRRAEKAPIDEPKPKREPVTTREERPEAGALEWSRLAGGAIVLAAIGALFLNLFSTRKAEVTPSASEGGPGPSTLVDGLLAGSGDVAHRLAEFSAAIRLGVELALRDAFSYSIGRALFGGAALVLAALLLTWWAGPPPSSPDPDQDDPRHSRFPV